MENNIHKLEAIIPQNDPLHLPIINFLKGELMIHRGMNEEGQQILKDNMELLKKTGYFEGLMKARLLIAIADIKMGKINCIEDVEETLMEVCSKKSPGSLLICLNMIYVADAKTFSSFSTNLKERIHQCLSVSSEAMELFAENFNQSLE